MPAAEQKLPNLLQRFEHKHSGSGIHLCMSKAITKNRSVLAIPTNALQEPKIDVARNSAVCLCSLSETRNRGLGAKPHTSMVALLPPKQLAIALAPDRRKRLKIETTRNAFTYVFSGSGKIENPAHRLHDRARLIGRSSIQ